MPVRRRYGQGCGTAHALDLVGDRWALLVVRELVLGPKRFTDLRDGLPGIGPNVLSQRLKEPEDAGALRSGALKLDGERAALDRFPELFRFPPSPGSA